jgi:hypothetical protein
MIMSLTNETNTWGVALNKKMTRRITMIKNNLNKKKIVNFISNMNTHIVAHNGKKRWQSQGSFAKEKKLSARKILPSSTKHSKKMHEKNRKNKM